MTLAATEAMTFINTALPPGPEHKGTSPYHVRRDKAALFQRVQAPPGDRSSRKQPGQAWR